MLCYAPRRFSANETPYFMARASSTCARGRPSWYLQERFGSMNRGASSARPISKQLPQNRSIPSIGLRSPAARHLPLEVRQDGLALHRLNREGRPTAEECVHAIQDLQKWLLELDAGTRRKFRDLDKARLRIPNIYEASVVEPSLGVFSGTGMRSRAYLFDFAPTTPKSGSSGSTWLVNGRLRQKPSFRNASHSPSFA